jgi:multidrug efflux pump subunit AcrB
MITSGMLFHGSGILVDGAIIVVEGADRRSDPGHKPRQALPKRRCGCSGP